MDKFFLILYILAGIIWVKKEHDLFDCLDWKDMTRLECILYVLQQIIHYTRIAITWPLYLLEDILIRVGEMMVENE